MRAEGEPTATDIWIYDVIGDDWYDPSLTAKELCQTDRRRSTRDEIVLHLSSPGGSRLGRARHLQRAHHAIPRRSRSRVEGWTAHRDHRRARRRPDGSRCSTTPCSWSTPAGASKVGNAAEMRSTPTGSTAAARIMRAHLLRPLHQDRGGAAARRSTPRRTSPPTRRSSGASSTTSWSPSRPPPVRPAAGARLQAWIRTAAHAAIGRTISARTRQAARRRGPPRRGARARSTRGSRRGAAGSGDAPRTMDRQGRWRRDEARQPETLKGRVTWS